MIELYNDDCLKTMSLLFEKGIKFDAIICDPPYGTVTDLKIDGWKAIDNSWDKKLDTITLFKLCEKLLRQNGVLILFSQEPYTSELRTSVTSNIEFAYPLIWLKNHFCNYLTCKKAPVSYFEDISVFYKKYDSECSNPLRDYFKKVLLHIGLSKTEIVKRMGNQKADHVFRTDTMQFGLCSEEVYNELTELFYLKNMSDYKSYSELKEIDNKHNIRTFNLPSKQKFKGNVLRYDKENTRFHPTQKPVSLLKDIIQTYTNKDDTILDFCMGGGSCGCACKELKRNFIGVELNKKYFEIAEKRINEYTTRKKLF